MEICNLCFYLNREISNIFVGNFCKEAVLLAILLACEMYKQKKALLKRTRKHTINSKTEHCLNPFRIVIQKSRIKNISI